MRKLIINRRWRRFVRRDFSLIELLVVISIMAIMVSMLLPALGQARRIAYKISCSSNLHQMGIAVQMYVNEYGYFPRAYQSATSRWVDQIKPYVNKSSALYVCPEDPVKAACSWDSSIFLSYGVNCSKFSGKNDYSFWYHVKSNRVKSVSGTIYITDCEPGKYYCGSAATYPVPYVEYRHKNLTFNAMFCDGHTADFRVSDAIERLWDAAQ